MFPSARAPEEGGEGLEGADQHRVPHAHLLERPASLAAPRADRLRSGEQERRGEKGHAHPREVVHPVEGELLQRKGQRPREPDGDREHQGHLPGGAPGRRIARHRAAQQAADLLAEIDDDSDERPDVEHDVEEDSGLGEARQQPLGEDEVGARGDRQELGQTLQGPSRIACQNVTDIDEV